MRKKKEKWVDDGRTIAPMTGEELPPSHKALYSGRERKRNLKNGGKSDLSRKERRALTRGLFLAMLPRLLVILCAFAIIFIVLYLWLI